MSNKAYRNIQSMLNEDYSVEVPLILIKKIFKNHEKIEEYEISCTDTYDREEIMFDFLEFFQLGEYPVNGDCIETKKEFIDNFIKKTKPHGVIVNWKRYQNEHK